MDKIKVILADDHHLFRDGIKSLLNDVPHIEVMDEVSNGEELLRVLESKKPDIVITDITMPILSEIEATTQIKIKYPDVKVLILSMHNDEEFIHNAIQSGANGYLPKDTRRNELLEAIESICEGNDYFNKDISLTMLKSYVAKTKKASANESKPQLTRRELEIVKLIAEGYINKEIAERLSISIRTVDSHKTNIMQKLELKSAVDLVKYAIKEKLIEL